MIQELAVVWAQVGQIENSRTLEISYSQDHLSYGTSW